MIALAVLLKDGKFLMVKNPVRGWEFPGGTVESGENCASAALRELREEAGIEAKILHRLPTTMGMCVYLVKFVQRCCDGEFESQFFSDLPEDLSYPEYEAQEILKIARKLR